MNDQDHNAEIEQLRSWLAADRAELETMRAAFRDLNSANDKLLDENFALAAGQCANVTGDEGGTPQCKRIAELSAGLADACELLHGWIAAKCPPRYRSEHQAHVENLRRLLGPNAKAHLLP